MKTCMWLIVLGMIGCSSDTIQLPTPSIGSVNGKVLLGDGKPLTVGHVIFIGGGRETDFTGSIESDGSFNIKDIPEGKYSVRIEPELPKMSGKGRLKRPMLPFPKKYASETTSGLTVVVQAGLNTLEPFKLSK